MNSVFRLKQALLKQQANIMNSITSIHERLSIIRTKLYKVHNC